MGTTNTTTLTATAPAASRTYTIPDAGANASFVMTEGSQIINGTKTLSGVTTVSNTTDSENNFSAQAIPNPFSGKTEISFRMKQAAFVSLDVYNSLGEKVASLIHENMQEGTHQQTLDAANLSKGVYFFKLSIGGKSVMHKIVLSK